MADTMADEPGTGVVYGTRSKIIRRVIMLDHASQFNDPSLVADGESIVVFRQSQVSDVITAVDATYQHLGIADDARPTGSCAVVDNQTQLVTRIIKADPDLDSWPDATIVSIDRVDVGWRYNGGTSFSARFVIFDRSSNDAGQAVVKSITWGDPCALPTATQIVNGTANVGDTVDIPEFVERPVVPTSGTQTI